jgi:hypothetical protein
MQITQLLLIAAVLVLVVGQRLKGQPLTSRRLLLLPAIVLVAGLYQSRDSQFSPGTLALLAVSAVITLGLGALRGATVGVYEQNGHLWYRYRWTTIAVWAVAIAVRLGISALAHTSGVVLPAGELMIALGLGLLGEGLVVAPRAYRTGVPFAPRSGSASRSASGLRSDSAPWTGSDPRPGSARRADPVGGRRD